MSENSSGAPGNISAGRGNEERSSEGRGRRNRAGRNAQGINNMKFKGRIDELSDHVYDTKGMRDGAEDFHRTTREIGEYIARTFKNGGEFRRAFDPTILAFEAIKEPNIPSDPTDMMMMEIWKMELREYRQHLKQRAELEKQAYALVIGQASPSVRDRLESAQTFSTLDASSDVMGLLQLIRSSLYSGATSRQPMHNLQEAQDKFMSLKQTERMTNSAYLEVFQSHLAAYEHLGGDIGMTEEAIRPFIIAADPMNITVAEKDAAKSRARDEYLGIRLLRRSDPNRYGALLADVENSFTRGVKSYPNSLTGAYDMLVNYVDPNKNRPGNDRSLQGLSFAQDQENDSGRGRRNPNGGRGGRGRGQGRSNPRGCDNNPANRQTTHATTIPQSDPEDIPDSRRINEASSTIIPYITDFPTGIFAQRHTNIPKSWILADSCSSVDIFSSGEYLTHIHPAQTPLTLHCNAGTVTISQQGFFGEYPEPIWYHPSGIANILSLRNLTKHYRITMDTKNNRNLTLHKCDGNTLEFKPSNNGLYYIDTNGVENVDAMWTLVTTVRERAQQYNRRELKEAEQARRMQNILMHPSDQQLGNSAIHHLRGCPITQQSIRVAAEVYGPNIGSLKGKTVHRPSPHVRAGADAVPPEILSRHRNVTLAIDIMFINKIPFFVTVSRNLRFVTVSDLANRQALTVEEELKRVVKLYQHRGFCITTILCDPEFECIRPSFPMLNTCSADEHVPEVERMIRTLKERTRSVYVTLPFRYLPRLLIKRLVANAALWWNALPAPNGASNVHSPRYLLVGNELSYDKHVRLEFGSYVQTHEEHSNDMRHRTLGAICLGPTGNLQGGHFFMSLTSGERIIRHRWTSLPMPLEAITRVSHIGRQQHMPSTLTFSNRHGREIFDRLSDHIEDPHPDLSDDDSTYSHASRTDASSAPDEDDNDDADTTDDDDTEDDNDDADITDDDDTEADDDDTDDDAAQIPAVPRMGPPGRQTTPVLTTQPQLHQHRFHPVTPAPPPSSPDSTGVMGTGMRSIESTGVRSIESTGVRSSESTVVESSKNIVVQENRTLCEEFEQAEQQGREDAYNPEKTASTRRSQQQARDDAHNPEKTDEHSYLTAILDTFDPTSDDQLFTLVTAQMTAKKGVETFGEAGEEAIEKELRQVLTRNVIHGVHASGLTHAQRRAALRYLMFLKEKRDGAIKGRGCADGRKQRIYKTKEETSSPTLSYEALMLSCVIDAYEGRHTLVCDIPGAFMQAYIDELLHIKLDGAILEVLLRMEPSYEQFVIYEKGKKVVYAQLDKALYGALQSALLFWKKLTGFLVETLGFTINPYDSCVANKTIGGKQFTIAWYVDDLKLSHEDPKVVEDMFDKIQAEFGKEAPLTVSRGKVHNYLGMVIDYTVDGKVTFTMPTLVDGIISQLPVRLRTGTNVTPAANHLFMVNEKSKKLSKEDADLFHRLTAQLLYLCKRARPDLQTAVAFLTTRVASPDIDDMRKLGRCIRYLRRTSHFPLTLEAACMRNIRWWVDASYAVHPDMRSHTGATVTLGKGSLYSMSTRQKMNTRSSTEAELVGVNDAMSIILWTRHFLEAQGYKISENIVYQDNESAMLLEKNGRRSSTKRTRHLEIRYFFVTDNVARKRLSIEYCPTGDMIADYFTKPLQGSSFRKLLKVIMNIDDEIIDSSPQECVGYQDTGESRTDRAEITTEPENLSTDPRNLADVFGSHVAKRTDLEAIRNVSRLGKNRSYADVVRS